MGFSYSSDYIANYSSKYSSNYISNYSSHYSLQTVHWFSRMWRWILRVLSCYKYVALCIGLCALSMSQDEGEVVNTGNLSRESYLRCQVRAWATRVRQQGGEHTRRDLQSYQTLGGVAAASELDSTMRSGCGNPMSSCCGLHTSMHLRRWSLERLRGMQSLLHILWQ